MPFDIVTRTALQHYTTFHPDTEDRWYGPWNTILTTLFPAVQGYIVAPQRRLRDGHLPDFIIEVLKMSAAPVTFRCVLIVKIRNSQHWEGGIPNLQRQLIQQIDASFTGTAYVKVYWIGAIGPHWRYGEKDYNGQPEDLRPLIDWHHVTDDQASFNDLQTLARLVAAL